MRTLLASSAFSLTLVVIPITAQEATLRSDEVREVVLTENYSLLEGRGVSRGFEVAADFSGYLYLWADSAEFDPFLRIEEEGGGLLFEDDNGGGGTTAFVRLTVEPGMRGRVILAAATSGQTGTAILHVVAAPETSEIRERASVVDRVELEVDTFRSEGRELEARELCAGVVAELLSIPGGDRSAVVTDALDSLGHVARSLEDSETTWQAWARVTEFRGRTLPELHSSLVDARQNLGAAAYGRADYVAARQLTEAVLEARQRALPEGDSALVEARRNLDILLSELGDLEALRRLRESVVEACERALPADHADTIRAQKDLVYTLEDLGDLATIVPIQEAIVASYERTFPEHHRDLVRARFALGSTLYRLKNYRAALPLLESVAAARERTMEKDDPALLRAWGNLAGALGALGDLERALPYEEAVLAGLKRANSPDLWKAHMNLAATLEKLGRREGVLENHRAAVAACERTLPEDHPDLTLVRTNLAEALDDFGEHDQARELLERVLESHERTLPVDHPDIIDTREDLAHLLHAMNEHDVALRLRESVLEARMRILPADHHLVQNAKVGIAHSRLAMGDSAGYVALLEEVVECFERTLPDDHEYTLRTRLLLSVELPAGEARTIQESVLEACEQRLPPDHDILIDAKAALGNSLKSLGDLAGAHALMQQVLEAYERTLPEGHADLLMARGNLARTLNKMGDFVAARTLLEDILLAWGETLSPDHDWVITTRGNLAGVLMNMGHFSEARALWEAALESEQRVNPPGHPDIASAREDLSAALLLLEDFDGMRAQLETCLQVRAKLYSENHPLVLRSRKNLATAYAYSGELERSLALHQAVLETIGPTLPASHPDILSDLRAIALLKIRLGDLEGAASSVDELASGTEARLVSLAEQGQTGELFGDSHVAFSILNYLGNAHGSESTRAVLFALFESLRADMAWSLGAIANRNPELAEKRETLGELRASLNDLVTGGRSSDEDDREYARRVSRLTRERDRVESELSELLGGRDALSKPVWVESVAGALDKGSAAAGYRRLQSWALRPDSGRIESGGDRLFVHLVNADGSFEQLDLGGTDELEQLALDWRESLGKPVERGFVLENDAALDERAAGTLLRERILDPLLERIDSSTKTLHLCPDDLLYLLPLDALPLGDGRVGDRYRILIETSFARILAPSDSLSGEPELLAMGGVSFGKKPAFVSPIPAATETTSRSALPVSFAPLLQTRLEAEATALLFEEAFEREGFLLTRKDATKIAFREHAPGKRFLHVATHGWFAPETVASTLDTPRTDLLWTPLTAQETVTGLAPMTLCGLAFAGANQGRDSMGRVPGILTAEELSGIDLSACDLAVLSACETNVGIRRAGQGIQSLQTALHAAGVRTAITSLWRVDDAMTRRLMELFYTYLWVEGMPKADALWNAKCDLRNEGAAVRDWAGWVLSGDPR